MTSPLTPAKAVKRLRKLKIELKDLETFKTNLLDVLDHSNDSEHESYHVHLVRDFLKNTYYKNSFFINTKDNKDLVIHSDKNETSPVSVIIETKRPSNLSGMPTLDDLNAKALQELLLYYLDERIHHKNEHITHLVITNSLEWFIFDAHVFDKYFYKNKKLLAEHKDYDQERMSGKGTDYFYTHIAKPFIDEVKNELEFTYVDIRKYKHLLNSDDPEKNKKLAPLYKVFSPDHLLKLPVANDSNSLDRKFYEELLYMIGLKEVKQGSKKLIDRYPDNERQDGSLIENAMMQLDEIGKIGKDHYYNTALELCISWVNRILFLKLLESQLISYHKGDTSYRILDSKIIHNYDDLNKLFFQILAKERGDRNPRIADIFSKIPYLNSSLFESTDIEKNTIVMSNLEDDIPLPIYKSSILKHKKDESLNAIEYLFKFLDAYDFSSEGNDEIQEEHKTLINASVLGLIFEKINGYKDGSYFTPGFITEYMSRETIRRAVVQKFNEAKGWDCKDLTAVYNKGLDIKEANAIVNSLKICDPAVGSGHFLVSALNEILAIKHFLGILCDSKGKRLFDYQVEVQNDDLLIYNVHTEQLFEYDPSNPQSRDIQQGLFHEKQTIIENCLFGVDINPNSVKICRLRLWIELLKNAYYKNDDELETLPNIDINIKCGNSLISKYDIKADLREALRKSKYDIDSYRDAVRLYQNAPDKEYKQRMRDLIKEIKNEFKVEMEFHDPLNTKHRKLKAKYNDLIMEQIDAFGMSDRDKKARQKNIDDAKKQLDKIEQQVKEAGENKIYENAFEWRFEFPEVLDKNGDFIGFDVVIGNPPYGAKLIPAEKSILLKHYFYQDYQLDTYLLFIERAHLIMKNNAEFAFIIPNTWITNIRFQNIRKFIFNNTCLHEIVHFNKAVFEEAVVDTELLFFTKDYKINAHVGIKFYQSFEQLSMNTLNQNYMINSNGKPINIAITTKEINLKTKIESNSINLGEITNIVVGLKPYQKNKGKPKQNRDDVKARVFDSKSQISDEYHKLLRGSDINKFSLNWTSGVWLKYGDHLAEPRYSANFFNDEKIVVRQTSDKLIATIDRNKYLCMNNLHVITKKTGLENINLNYILGLINSKLMDFYYTLLNPEKGEALAEVKKENIAMLPIITDDSKYVDLISEQVRLCLEMKDMRLDTDIKNIEREIDQLVYELYGLTEEEIKIVEGDE